jgi:ferric-dicitrate binding protein FerR (iron transport regulator)
MDTARRNQLFQKYFDRTATAGEVQELLDWIGEQGDADIVPLMDKAWDDFHGQGIVFTEEQSEKMIRSILQVPADPPQGEGRMKRAGRTIAVVLVMIAAVLVTTWGLLSPGRKGRTTSPAEVRVQDDVAPGRNKAVLSLAGGSTILLDSVQDGLLARQGKTSVMKLKGGKLSFAVPATGRTGNRRSAETGYNILTTPRGGQYQLLLPDGSRVWLNAASSLKFPAAFAAGSREVELRGEAYFEIAPDRERPFQVTVRDRKGEPVKVTVLGTHFDIKAYRDEPAVTTTLLEGSVKVGRGDEAALLEPAEQASITPGAPGIGVRHANVEDVVGWKNGFFHFDGDDMGTIMRKIERWYDVTVSYEGAVPPGHFTGVISRHTNLSEVLKMLELSGVHFRLQGKQIIVGS